MFLKISGQCGGIFKDKYGHLTSPGFPNLQSCIYEILQPNNTFIKLTILQFNLTFDTTCNDEFLEIRDGYTAESPLIGKFCGIGGIDIPSTILSFDVSCGRILFRIWANSSSNVYIWWLYTHITTKSHRSPTHTILFRISRMGRVIYHSFRLK